MGFLKWLFGKKKTEPGEEDWDSLVYSRADVDFGDRSQREKYVTDCLEQIAEATKETKILTGEYSLVTSYLMDSEEVEALPEEQRGAINKTAHILKVLEDERSRYHDKKNRMSDSDFYLMRKQEEEIEEGIRKLRRTEEYGEKIKQDLRRIDRERQAYSYRKQELEIAQNNMRGMVVIFLVALAICLAMLCILQFVFEMNTYIGYFVSVMAAAIAVTVLCVRYLDAKREREQIVRTINKLIRLNNKVKIRYVNHTNLLDYLYMKYNVDSASKLEKRWKCYQQEKEERKQYAEAEAKIEFHQKELVAQLSQFRIHDPQRWINQVDAILDDREMVELRHKLILRRQALRKQLDYNQEVAEAAHKEIMDIVELYPRYAMEIKAMVDSYPLD